MDLGNLDRDRYQNGGKKEYGSPVLFQIHPLQCSAPAFAKESERYLSCETIKRTREEETETMKKQGNRSVKQ